MDMGLYGDIGAISATARWRFGDEMRWTTEYQDAIGMEERWRYTTWCLFRAQVEGYEKVPYRCA